MNYTWKKIKDENGPNLKYLKTHLQQYQSSDTEQLMDILVVSSSDAANVIPITADLEVVMVKQFRFGIEEFTTEIPGGLIESGESSLGGIKRELAEETGYTSDHWKHLGSLPFNPVYHKNYIHHFIAENACLTESRNLDLGEEIELILMPLSKVIPELKAGKFSHPHTISAFMLAFDHLSSLIH